MKTRTTLNLLAVAAAALSLNITTGTAQYVDSVESLKNHALASSPRALEAFPWLVRTYAPRPEACCAEANARDPLTEARKNRAFAASPRVLEMFPELARGATPVPEFTLAPLVERRAVPAAVENSAVRSSPRTREELPALSRGVAPEKGSAKGVAPKVTEPTK
jgi:hypothetical protein